MRTSTAMICTRSRPSTASSAVGRVGCHSASSAAAAALVSTGLAMRSSTSKSPPAGRSAWKMPSYTTPDLTWTCTV